MINIIQKNIFFPPCYLRLHSIPNFIAKSLYNYAECTLDGLKMIQFKIRIQFIYQYSTFHNTYFHIFQNYLNCREKKKKHAENLQNGFFLNKRQQNCAQRKYVTSHFQECLCENLAKPQGNFCPSQCNCQVRYVIMYSAV